MEFNYNFKVATKSEIEANIDDLIAIDKHYFNEEGWSRDAFLSEIDGKFENSLLLFDNGKVIGYSILSKRDYGYHWHKLVLHHDYTAQGLGKKFFKELMNKLANEKITLKVDITNINTVIYHLKNGALFVDKSGHYYTMSYNG
jgi:hypothetical protein